MLPCFDPIHCPDFGTDFWLGKKGNLDYCQYSQVCKNDKRIVIGLLQTVFKCIILIFLT